MKLGIAIALLLSGVILSGAYAAYAAQQNYSTIDVSVTVHTGDTLWSICEREAEIAGDSRDIREIIFETSAANGIKDGGIYAGQKLIVKVQKGGR